MDKQFMKQTIETLYPCQVGIIKARVFTELSENLQKYHQMNHELQLLENNINNQMDPFRIMEKAQSIIVVIFPYGSSNPISKESSIVSRSSWGTDYHLVIKDKLNKVKELIQANYQKESLVLCDNHPLHERHLAYLAGLGNFGKNTLLINKTYGSYFFISLILTELEFDTYDEPRYEDICKDCSRCITACPTKAISESRFLKVQNCLSYLTQSKANIPEEFLSKFSKFTFGCDFCQVSCVYNSKDNWEGLPEFKPTGREKMTVQNLRSLSNKQFKTKYGTLGASFRGKNVLLRNAILISANKYNQEDLHEIESIDDCGNQYLKQAIDYAIEKLKEGEK